MAWRSLQNSLGSKPRVLAGPILRKVTPKAVTVWLALRKPGSVTLTVLDQDKTKVMEGSRHAVSVGQNLHIVAVTAKLLPVFQELTEGVAYQYNLLFDFDDNLSTNLATATNNAPLSYPPFGLPSFALPPRDLNLLRLIQGSCRMPHAEGKDTLPIVDDLIAETAANAFARPHQLLLTGDQIYADDVSDIMSLVLADAGDVLLGWKEQYMSDVPVPGSPRAVIDLYPMLRQQFLSSAGFTSDDLRCHMIGLGEYLSMYLFVWSDALWPSAPDTLPNFDELAALFGEKINAMDEEILGGMVGLEQSRRAPLISLTATLQEFRRTLPKVRRALANIPSYMIFDDHEVTDDWNMTGNISLRMYGSSLGQRLIQNALVAYSLCQHWGNAPEQFDGAATSQPGSALLQLLDTANPTAAGAFKQKSAAYDQNSASVRAIVGVPDATTIRTRLASRPENLFHEVNSLVYNFTVEGPGHQVIFTDTRSWRSFPNGLSEQPDLLSKSQFRQQILNATPSTGNKALIVVVSTNAPPVPPIRSAAQHSTIANKAEHYPDIYEAWDIPTAAFDRLLVTLTERLPLDSSGERRGPVILLSGDVHFSFASRLIYRAKSRFEDLQSQRATAVFAQLVASSFKKQTDRTIGFHREGYRFAPFGTQWLIPEYLTEGYIGWNVPAGTVLNAGTQTESPHQGPGNAYIRELKFKRPTTVKITKTFENTDVITNLTSAPTYRYRLDYLLPTQQQVQLNTPPMPPIPAGATPDQRKQAANAYKTANQRYRMYNALNPPKVVGRNNFSEVTFVWGSGDKKKVIHTLRWWESGSASMRLTVYEVNLDPNAMDLSGKLIFPDLKAETGDP